MTVALKDQSEIVAISWGGALLREAGSEQAAQLSVFRALLRLSSS